MPLLTRDDVRRQSWFAWVCLAALAGVAAWFWTMDKRGAAMGTVAALAGCLGLLLPPRERMEALPRRVRELPRSLDAAPVQSATVTVHKPQAPIGVPFDDVSVTVVRP